MAAPAVTAPSARISSARRSVAVIFVINGLAQSSWSVRLPALRDALDLSTAQIGLVLLALSAGSLIMLPATGTVVAVFGPARTVLTGIVVSVAGISVVGLAQDVWTLSAGLFFAGAGMGAWDVAMNVEGAAVERQLGRVVMPRFHAGFSLGTVLGAGTGALAAATGLSLRVHLPLVALTVLVTAVVAVRFFLPPAAVGGGERPRRPVSVAAWLEPRTLLIGALVFSMALAEGSANDWLTLAVVDGYGAPHDLGAAVFGVFVTGMTLTRLAGPGLLGRLESTLVLRLSALLVLVGSGLVIAGSVLAGHRAMPGLYVFAVAGALLWGTGAALGFPMGMSAASTDPAHSAARVGVVSTIGYTAFIAGPPLLGALGQHVGVARSLVGVSVAVLLALLTAGAVRSSEPGAGADRMEDGR